MDQPPYSLDGIRRETVLASFRERCTERHWRLLAAEVRPERVMHDLKSYTSRCLNHRGLDGPARKRWAREYAMVVEAGECVGGYPVCG